MTVKTGEIDTLELTQALIRCASVTPADAGALDVVQAALAGAGFTCQRLPFGEGAARVDNLYARIGTGRPSFCFAGHTDVVPVGDSDAWSADPFGGEIRDGFVYGRGAADMKGAVAAFAAAAAGFLAARGERFDGSISLLITGDEEGPAINGTARVVEWLAEKGEAVDFCLVGEPTNPETMGEMIKIGRRGSLNARLTVHGTQGHVAYPDLAANPAPVLLAMLTAITAEPLDDGSEHFQPSNLEITSIDIGNPAPNIIPARAGAAVNIRFNDKHTGAGLKTWLSDKLAAAADGMRFVLDVEISGESFYSPPGPLSDAVANAVAAELGVRPELSTSGGTSDARFLRALCPVAEFGLVGRTMHKVDERTAVADLEALVRIYRHILDSIFPSP